jgi:hypothetical protein
LIEYAPVGLSEKLLVRCHGGSSVEQVAYSSGRGCATSQLLSHTCGCSDEPFDRGWPFSLGDADRRIRLGERIGHAYRRADHPPRTHSQRPILCPEPVERHWPARFAGLSAHFAETIPYQREDAINRSRGAGAIGFDPEHVPGAGTK